MDKLSCFRELKQSLVVVWLYLFDEVQTQVWHYTPLTTAFLILAGTVVSAITPPHETLPYEFKEWMQCVTTACVLSFSVVALAIVCPLNRRVLSSLLLYLSTTHVLIDVKWALIAVLKKPEYVSAYDPCLSLIDRALTVWLILGLVGIWGRILYFAICILSRLWEHIFKY